MDKYLSYIIHHYIVLQYLNRQHLQQCLQSAALAVAIGEAGAETIHFLAVAQCPVFTELQHLFHPLL